MSVRGKDSYSIHAVENAIDVLEALCDEEGEVSLSRLSERLQMNKASVFRLLATFEGRGYVERNGGGKYRLGLAAFEVGQRLLSRMTLLRQARPVMEQLVRECNEAAYLIVRRDQEALFFDMVDTSQQVKIVSLVGQRVPLEDSVVGRIFLVFEDGMLSGKEGRLTETEAEGIRSSGLCVGVAGVDAGVMCAAVPIFSATGDIVAALALLWPDFRADSQRVENDLLPELCRAGDTVSSKLGYLGHYLGRELVGRDR